MLNGVYCVVCLVNTSFPVVPSVSVIYKFRCVTVFWKYICTLSANFVCRNNRLPDANVIQTYSAYRLRKSERNKQNILHISSTQTSKSQCSFRIPYLRHYFSSQNPESRSHAPTGFIYTPDVFTGLWEVYGIGQTRKWLIAKQRQGEWNIRAYSGHRPTATVTGRGLVGFRG